jgi:predicted transcriptional regulator of viral defense system
LIAKRNAGIVRAKHVDIAGVLEMDRAQVSQAMSRLQKAQYIARIKNGVYSFIGSGSTIDSQED